MTVASLYLHIPFCRHMCSYCDFNTYAGLDRLIPAYVDALCREAARFREAAGRRVPVHTIFFGGGTPSLLSPAQLAEILTAMDGAFECLPGAEITLEANPGTFSFEALMEIRRLGVNRLSLGMQSARPEALELLARDHTYPDVIRSVTLARRAGFDNVSLDLIYGLPGQTLAAWQATLEHAVALGPNHFSIYALSLEPDTPLHIWVHRGLMVAPDPDLAAGMYEWASERLAAAGFEQYEISNWARTDADGRQAVCRHNLQYWRNLPYIGLGAGAHGYLGGYRTANVLAPAAYIRRVREGASEAFPGTPATEARLPIDRATEMQETMLMGLRLTQEGIEAPAFEARFGERPERIFQEEVEGLVEAGLLTWVRGEVLRLTPRGRLLGNQVFLRFV